MSKYATQINYSSTCIRFGDIKLRTKQTLISVNYIRQSKSSENFFLSAPRRESSPNGGFKLTVFSRAEVPGFIPPSEIYICRDANANADACELFLYNRLNERMRGMHYEPLLVAGAPVQEEEVLAGKGAGAEAANGS